MKNLWQPAVVAQWFDFEWIENEKKGRIFLASGVEVHLDLGCSYRFLQSAKQVMVSVYTIGSRLDRESSKASSKGDFLKAYIIDLIGLIALDKTASHIIQLVEQKAHSLEWGVSPFLSPGSIHGWKLEEQSKLCRLLPIEEIGVRLLENHTLYPLKTITSLIGIGPDFKATVVGTPCDVCDKRIDCHLS